MAVIKWGSERTIGTTGDFAPNAYDIVGLANGGYAVAWQDNGFPQKKVHLQVFDAFDREAGEKTVLPGASAQSSPQLAALADGGFVVSYTNATNSGDPQFTRFSANGQVVQANGGFFNLPAETEQAVSALGSGFITAFRSGPAGAGDIAVAKYSANGSL